MNKMNTEILFAKGLQHLNIDLPADRIELLHTYYAELEKWSRRSNLVSKTATPEEIVEKHFLDSLTLLPVFASSDVASNSLLDVGTGAGFPGLVLKVACPELAVTLVEPREKRAIFLRHIIRTLGLKNIAVVNSKIEDEQAIPPDSGFSHITSRAVAEPALFLQMIGRLLTPGTRVILMLSQKKAELPLDDGAGRHFTVDATLDRILPFSAGSRRIVVLKTV